MIESSPRPLLQYHLIRETGCSLDAIVVNYGNKALSAFNEISAVVYYGVDDGQEYCQEWHTVPLSPTRCIEL